MQQPDYYYQYSQNPNNPNPHPTDHYPPTNNFPPPPYSSTASAPPYTTNYAAAAPPPPPSDYSSYPPNTQTPDPAPLTNLSPTAPSYAAQPSGFPQFESHAPYQPQPPPQSQPQSYYHSNYSTPAANPNPNLNNPSSNYQYSPYENTIPYESTAPKYDQNGGGIRGYADDYSGRYGGYGGPLSDSGQDVYGGSSGYDSGGYGANDGVYAYQGSKVEPYGSKGTGSKSSMWKDNNQQVMFDDFGRPIGLPSGNGKSQSSGSPKIVKAVPKADSQQDAKGGGVQKFRVKLLAESGGQSSQDVLCQIGLDGIRMLDPSSSRTLRIYPLDTITRCEVFDSSTFAFWSKSSVDFDARRIRLQSNSYTTNTLLDTVTAATVQLKEMGGRSRPADPVMVAEQSTEKKKGLGDWMNIIKPVNEEKDHWVPDEAAKKCASCGSDFGAFLRRHHCRNCGDIFCDKCTQGRIALTAEDNAPQVRVCDRCMAEVTTRLSNAKEKANRSTVFQSHEDLAKKLQEELERNRKSSSGSKSDGSGRRMKEVECPTCTVHLQVQVPSSGSETIECGVCQHPFLVSAH